MVVLVANTILLGLNIFVQPSPSADHLTCKPNVDMFSSSKECTFKFKIHQNLLGQARLELWNVKTLDQCQLECEGKGSCFTSTPMRVKLSQMAGLINFIL